MKIKKLELHNFRSAYTTSFEFDDRLNLFVGINGSGKTTVLDALSLCLSWLVKRIEKDKGRGAKILDSDITNNEIEGSLNISLTNDDSSWNWRLANTRKGHSSKMDSNFNQLSKLATSIKKKYEKDLVLPVISYYPVDRTVKSISPVPPSNASLYNLKIYENAFGSKTNYQAFFEWFRLQDDILNEKKTSRLKSLKQKAAWLEDKVNLFLKLLKKSLKNDGNLLEREDFKYIIKCFEKDTSIYQEPKFLFRQLTHIIDWVGIYAKKSFTREVIFHDLKNMFNKIAFLDDEITDNLIGAGGISKEIFVKNIENFEQLCREEKNNKEMISFLWESFIFVFLLNFWWFSDDGRKRFENKLRLQLKKFFDYKKKYHPQMIENLVDSLEKIIKQEYYNNEKPKLQVIKNAIEQFLPEYDNLCVKREPHPHMEISKNKEIFDLQQLSDGERNLIVLVGDIAHRLFLGNPNATNPLAGDGIILIDEIDLHLHPKWQRLVIPKLLEIFPNCQFFISTHSPQVISHVKPEKVFLLEQNENSLSYQKPTETYGMSLDRIVELVMDDESKPKEISDKLENLFELIEREKFDVAKVLIKELKKDMQTDPNIMRAETLIRQSEMRK